MIYWYLSARSRADSYLKSIEIFSNFWKYVQILKIISDICEGGCSDRGSAWSATPGLHSETSMICQTPTWSTWRGCGSAGSSSCLRAHSGIAMEWRRSTNWPSSAFFTTSSHRPLWVPGPGLPRRCQCSARSGGGPAWPSTARDGMVPGSRRACRLGLRRLAAGWLSAGTVPGSESRQACRLGPRRLAAGRQIFRATCKSCHSSTNPRHNKNLVNDPEKVLAIPLLLRVPLCLF